jgi:hypothetical protein
MDQTHRHLVAIAILAGLLGLAACARTGSGAPPAPAHTSFATPDEAVAALVSAAQQGDVSTLQSLLGPGSEKLLSSGDAVQDKTERENFLARYQAHHELVAGSPSDLVLLVGDDRWPLPIPLVRTADRWSFDGAAGAQELVLRRIGSNELRTIDVMRGFVAAQEDYAAAGHDGSAPGIYAMRLRSSPGKQDGLHWETEPGAPQSPAGPLLADAGTEGYAVKGDLQSPYHGYYYKLLLSQGPDANGGARAYVQEGKLTGGFAALAYPAEYGASGIMTFMVNQDGTVWQRDLGSKTTEAARAIDSFNPDGEWTPIAPEE